MKSLGSNPQITSLLLDYLMREAAIIVTVINSSGIIEDANFHMEKLADAPVVGTPFSAMAINFLETFSIHTYAAEDKMPVLLNIKTAGALPQTYYFHFHRLDGKILAIGQQDQQEAENMRSILLGLNNELSNLTRQLQKNTIALEQADIQKNQFFGMAAHDIRHPLSVIRMFSDFLAEETAGQLSEMHGEFLGYIRKSAVQMENILNDFLDFSVFEAGRLILARDAVDFTVWLVEAVERNRTLAAQKGVDIVLLPFTIRPVLTMDESKMTQVLDNLLSNATKFSSSGDRVTVELLSLATEIQLSIQDHGPGISKENQQRLFNPFVKLQAAPQQKEKSSGLGLAIVKKIIDAHGGRVWVESNPGQGATFSFTLPL